MLKSIEIINFQSHKDTLIELSEGITSLVGESNEGKSAILRAIDWGVNNKPSGTGFVSYWAKHDVKNGVVIDLPCKVIFKKTDGSELIRERSDKFNGYYIDKKALEASGVGVPVQVAEWFNMGEVNIQSQHESLFLLYSGGKGGQEVARFLNSVVKLDEIPRALSKVNKLRLASKDSADVAKKEIQALQKEIVKHEWVEKAEPFLQRLEALVSSIEETEFTKSEIEKQLKEIDRLTFYIESFKWIAKAEPILEMWEFITSQGEKEASYFRSMAASIEEYCKKNEFLNKNEWIFEAHDLLLEIEKCDLKIKKSEDYAMATIKSLSRYDSLEKEANTTKGWLPNANDIAREVSLIEKEIEKENKLLKETKEVIDKYNNMIDSIVSLKKEIKIISKKLPEICPLCGGTLNENSQQC